MIGLLISLAFLSYLIIVIVQAIIYTFRIWKDPEFRIDKKQEEQNNDNNDPEIYDPENDETY